jgi:hypothetical protein
MKLDRSYNFRDWITVSNQLVVYNEFIFQRTSRAGPSNFGKSSWNNRIQIYAFEIKTLGKQIKVP